MMTRRGILTAIVGAIGALGCRLLPKGGDQAEPLQSKQIGPRVWYDDPVQIRRYRMEYRYPRGRSGGALVGGEDRLAFRELVWPDRPLLYRSQVYQEPSDVWERLRSRPFRKYERVFRTPPGPTRMVTIQRTLEP